MRIALIGCDYHWHNYAAAFKHLPHARVVAVATGAPEEKLAAFDGAPGVTPETQRFDDPCRLLDEARPELVQVSTHFSRMGRWNMEALRRGIPVFSEKPVAFGLEELAELWEAGGRGKVPFAAGQGVQGDAAFEAAREAVRAGRIGEALASYHQKSYRWGTRPESWKDRRTFPGVVPWVGVHALAWMTWILGDVFTEVAGWEGVAARPEYPACASQAGAIFRQSNGGFAMLSMDYLRPASAPTHGDERLRIAGTQGVVEVRSGEKTCALIEAGAALRDLAPSAPPLDAFTRFAKSLLKEGPPPMESRETFRVTELAFLTQRALDEGKPVGLRTTLAG